MDQPGINLSIIRSRRARRLRISVSRGGAVEMTLPFGMPAAAAEKFLKAKRAWIEKSLAYFANQPLSMLPRGSRREYLSLKNKAQLLAEEKAAYWNRHYGFAFRQISIKNQKSRWGSCSRKGNLNFNYRIVHLPKEVLDYLVIHELCHLREFNHSPQFWQLVAKAAPEYRQLRRKLKNYF